MKHTLVTVVNIWKRINKLRRFAMWKHLSNSWSCYTSNLALFQTRLPYSYPWGMKRFSEPNFTSLPRYPPQSLDTFEAPARCHGFNFLFDPCTGNESQIKPHILSDDDIYIHLFDQFISTQLYWTHMFADLWLCFRARNHKNHWGPLGCFFFPSFRVRGS